MRQGLGFRVQGGGSRSDRVDGGGANSRRALRRGDSSTARETRGRAREARALTCLNGSSPSRSPSCAREFSKSLSSSALREVGGVRGRRRGGETRSGRLTVLIFRGSRDEGTKRRARVAGGRVGGAFAGAGPDEPPVLSLDHHVESAGERGPARGWGCGSVVRPGGASRGGGGSWGSPDAFRFVVVVLVVRPKGEI